MEAVAAIALAGNILQFTGVAGNFILLAKRLHNAASDEESDRTAVSLIAKDLKILLAKLLISIKDDPEDCGIKDIADACVNTGQRLLEVMSKLDLSSTPRKRDTFMVAIRTLFKQDEIKSLQDRLDSYRAQLNLQLVYSIRRFAIKSDQERKSAVQKLYSIEQGVQDIQAMKSEMTEVGGLAKSILHFLVSQQHKSGDHLPFVRKLQLELANVASDPNARVPDRYREGDISLTTAERRSAQDTFLSGLGYVTMMDRESRVALAHDATLQWVLTEQDAVASTTAKHRSSLASWLSSDNQLFWLTGKAGSGKSTLMKYLCGRPANVETAALSAEPRARSLLERWAQDKPLLIMSYYFWNSGADVQMTQEGLFMTLLHQMLEQRPDVMPSVFPVIWERLCLFDQRPGAWDVQSLQDGLLQTVRLLSQEERLCFFIDGLDEFNGSHDRLISMVKKLVDCSSNIKVVVASRPWNVFETALGKQPSLRLEDLNYVDIKNFVQHRCHADDAFDRLRIRREDFTAQLLENIVAKSSGVFLWVDLVVASLLAGIRFGDRLEDLQRRLDELPPDLEHLYEKILRDLDPFYLSHASQYFSLVEAAPAPLTILQFAFADEETIDTAIQMPLGQLDDEDITRRIEDMGKRINSRCKGLLEIERAWNSTTISKLAIAQDPKLYHKKAFPSVQYLHRTVRDFIKSDAARRYLESKQRADFDPCICLAAAYFIDLKHRDLQVELRMLETWPNARATNVSAKFCPTTELILSCVRSARNVTAANSGKIVRLFDEIDHLLKHGDLKQLILAFDRFAGPLVSVQEVYLEGGHDMLYSIEKGSEANFKSRVFERAMRNAFGVGSFISLACREGVVPYVKARTRWGGYGPRAETSKTDKDTDTWPLMFDALAVAEVKPDMVACLLDLGADPNYRIGRLSSQALWLIALRRLVNMREVPNELDSDVFDGIERRWEVAVQMLFARGAKVTEDQAKLLSPSMRMHLMRLKVDLPPAPAKISPSAKSKNAKQQGRATWTSSLSNILGSLTGAAERKNTRDVYREEAYLYGPPALSPANDGSIIRPGISDSGPESPNMRRFEEPLPIPSTSYRILPQV